MAQQVFNLPTTEELKKEIEEVVLDAPNWLLTPNDQLGGRQPIELVNGGEEDRLQVYNLIKAIEHGMMT
ncbi:MAG TPA: MbcA/ParS/Xre antitoxin family protein [Pyrinomonadaceae bacterium]|nr:MbcA/ParS/Xre antitoxin family protein [Pyrinomonadaceae bacterium]